MSQLLSTNKFQVITEPPQNLRHKYDFIQNFRPIYIVSRVFGMMPFSIVYQANGDIESSTITKFDILWLSISICIYSFGIYTQAQFIFPRGSDIYTSHLVVLSDNITVMLGLILGLFAICFDMYNRSKFVEVVKKFSNFDKKVIEICTFCSDFGNEK